MQPYNEHWERWCRISIEKHFQRGVELFTNFFIEGFERDTEALQDYIEIRVDGPYIRENANDQWRLYFEVNILCVAQENNEDVYRLNRLTGRVGSLFENILVYKYGQSVEDDERQIGCLRITPRAGEKIQTSFFGKINPATRILQASVEGHYNIFFD